MPEIVARDCITSHIRRWRNEWGDKPEGIADFEESFGWYRDRLVDDMARARMCQYCREPYNEERTITLDIIDPGRLPYYETNVAFCCGKCNASKGGKSPDEWGLWLRYTRQWKANH